MDSEERVPGITFHLETASVGPSETHEGFGKVTLVADVDDLEMWDEVVKKLGELRIYDVDDFKTNIIELLQEDIKSSDRELEQHRSETHSVVEHLKQRVDILEQEKADLVTDLKKTELRLTKLWLKMLKYQAAELESIKLR